MGERNHRAISRIVRVVAPIRESIPGRPVPLQVRERHGEHEDLILLVDDGDDVAINECRMTDKEVEGTLQTQSIIELEHGDSGRTFCPSKSRTTPAPVFQLHRTL